MQYSDYATATLSRRDRPKTAVGLLLFILPAFLSYSNSNRNPPKGLNSGEYINTYGLCFPIKSQAYSG